MFSLEFQTKLGAFFYRRHTRIITTYGMQRTPGGRIKKTSQAAYLSHLQKAYARSQIQSVLRFNR